MNTFINNNKFNKKKVVFIMGATRTGKFHLFVDLATHFRGEIINSDKRQVYKGLEIVTNKIAHTKKQDSDFTAKDFCLQAIVYIEIFLKTQPVPIIYDTCFIWIDVEQSVSNHRVEMRVDQMVNVGLVDEVRQIFIPDADYTKGI
ncbi:hypothetical protein H5410_020888 [Solanum commersonii]|uniref:Isopentenyltransferase n=1 Tax=Solanum commersonii TaxID=4109 RepID=A0A9J5ZCF1_SOLCO|nr:hypothetical protein H5410_020888 [Solanum commersonii]